MVPERKISLRIDTKTHGSHRISKSERKPISRMSSNQTKMYDLSLFDITQASTTKQKASTALDSAGNEVTESRQPPAPEQKPLSLHRHHQISHHRHHLSSSNSTSSSSSHSRSTSQAEAINELLTQIRRHHRPSASTSSQSSQPDATLRRIHPHRHRLNPAALQDIHHSLRQNHGNANLRHS